MSSLVFDSWIREIGKDRIAVASDTPGYGGSDAPSRPVEIADFAAAMIRFMDEMTFKVVDVMGLARLAALVPPLRMHLTRYHGVFAPHSKLRAAIPPAGRGAGRKGARQDPEAPAVPKHAAMSWAQRLKRVFAIEIDHCARCQGRLRVIASIEEPEMIARILAHRDRDGELRCRKGSGTDPVVSGAGHALASGLAG